MSCHDHDHEQENAGARRSPALTVVSDAPARPAAPKQWRSLEEQAGSPAVLAAAQREFPVGASELRDDASDGGTSRRGFVQLMGASLALTGTACYRPGQKIVPYVRRPVEVTPGNPLHFATSYALEGHGVGYLVESYTGRPTKIEGNPDHPDSPAGTSTAIDQALLLNLYDHTRPRDIRHKGGFMAWREALNVIGKNADALSVDGGARLRFLLEPNASPLVGDLRARISKRFPKAKFTSFSSVADDAAVEGARLAFGRPLETRHDLTNADVIVALDADFMNEGIEQLRLSRQFSDRRDPQAAMNRLYVAEPCLTVTGSMADHRLRARGSDVLALAQALAAEVSRLAGGDVLAPVAGLPRAGSAPNEGDLRWVAAAAKDLARVRGRGVVITGRRQPAAVHAIVNLINMALGNVGAQGAAVSFFEPLIHDAAHGPAALAALAEEIASGQVDTLVITAWNPVYAAPADLKFGKLLERVPNVYYLGLNDDDTAAVASTFVPCAHVLETWGDTRATDGTVSLVQPLIAPLWSGVTESDLLAAFAGNGDVGSHTLLKDYWRTRALAENRATALDFEGVWETWLGRGIVPNTAATATTVAAAPGAAAAIGPLLQAAGSGGGLEIAFTVDTKVFDGRFATNVWLQELPHPITKITWDNALLVSKTTAGALGVKTGDVAKLELRGVAVEGPVYVQPGHADDVVTVALGYGRRVNHDVGTVGFNANLLRSSSMPWYDRGASLKRVRGNYEFGITQLHWSMEGREPAMATNLKEFRDHHSKFNQLVEERRAPMVTIHEPVDYSKQAYKWGMVIDLAKCNGCSACVVACQSENNIPVVGRHNVNVGREMHWLRIDRYYEGDVENPEVVTQPVGCVHCETAPCEYVCPVNATVHSDEGLNEMVYNRCIGTRYCSNNCPYKARRFNFFDYHQDVPATGKMASNPDVTVRSRGIMEKCTYCVQRIERARIDSRVEGRTIAENEVVTACQQSCPTGAIVFGSLNDPNHKVTKLYGDARRYNLLNEINTRPRTVYLARVRNPNPEL